jgi:hypothetical protein
MPDVIPYAAITFNRETGKFGFSFWVPGKKPHYSTETFDSADDVRNWLDPQQERVWERLGPETDSGIVEISRGYKPGVPTRL